ncbi:sulfotransferase [Halobacillus halophilus]|uniref:Sulfotransferase n=1 Tax=Halobacillus halophilus (strain ATCC 35676 / DSM 2266 / JCM 20832 / KCTC 3685 / LMG 17431 / NBRC 102448 / NCIMB 2269) TaxID=866895 RepID=I0JRJ7_HALH3|nr:sulfotransferase [Halobacillus halophilus]ASF40741.1 sulfotransferase [Halobacillus halophilus]CCG46768.1 sulfotransferase [Halobacillus halophilus DSM 2266]
MEVNINKPIFIIGVGRSGTTLLQSILSSHKNVTFTPETHFFRFYLGSEKKYFHLNRKSKTKVIEELKEDKYFRRLGNLSDNILAEYKSSEDMSLIDIYKKVLEEYAISEGKSYVGDKDPKNIELLHLIKQHFPEALIINMTRDPRDVIASRMKADWSKSRSVYSHLFAYKAQSIMSARYGKKLFNSNFFNLKYENLLKDPKKYIEPICKKLGVEYDPSMLNFQSTAEKLVSSEEMQWKKESTGPLLKDNVGKWQGTIENYKLALIEEVLKKTFKTNNYIPSQSIRRLSLIQRVSITVLNVSYLILTTIYINNKLRSVKKLCKLQG